MKVTKEMTNALLDDILGLKNNVTIIKMDFAVNIYGGLLRLVLNPYGPMLLTKEQILPLFTDVMLSGLDPKNMGGYEDDFYKVINQMLSGIDDDKQTLKRG